MMKTKTIEISVDDEIILVTIRRASTKDGVRRYQMMVEGEEQNKNETDEAVKPLRLVTFPAVMCSTDNVSGDGFVWPLTFEQFIDLPQVVTDPWVNAIYEMNPQWSGRKTETPEEQEKKEEASSKESKNT